MICHLCHLEHHHPKQFVGESLLGAPPLDLNLLADPLKNKTRIFDTGRTFGNLQAKRSFIRKCGLVWAMGGRCTHRECAVPEGYYRNLSALSFHHLDASKKEIYLDQRTVNGASWERILKEAAKCVLCQLCHSETHNSSL